MKRGGSLRLSLRSVDSRLADERKGVTGAEPTSAPEVPTQPTTTTAGVETTSTSEKAT